MPEVPAADVPASWRKRHPVLSRALLYGACVVLVGAAIFGLRLRAEINRRDHLAYLESRLDGMDLLMGSDPDGRLTLEALDAEYAAGDLPAYLEQRALRVRAFAYLKAGRGDKAQEALDRALALATDDAERAAIAIERSQLHTTAEEPTEALEVLDGVEVGPDDAVLFLWHALARALALEGAGRRDEVIPVLEQALDALPRPLPAVAPVYLANTAWTPREAAFHATSTLADLSILDSGPRPWTRLLALCPADFEVASRVALRLARAGHDDEAAISWAHARELDPRRALRGEERHEELRRLGKNIEAGLKPSEGGGR